MGWGLIATVASGLFAGAAIYINVVEHPARMRSGTPAALAQFGPSYHRAAIMQGTLAAAGFIAAMGAWQSQRDPGWLLGGLVLGAVIPFTLLVIFPTNKRLFHPSLDVRSPEATDLLNRWARLHAVRSILGACAFLLFVFLGVPDR